MSCISSGNCLLILFIIRCLQFMVHHFCYHCLIQILTILKRNLDIPVTCKIRLLKSSQETVELAQQIEKTGVAALAVHGRYLNSNPHNLFRKRFNCSSSRRFHSQHQLSHNSLRTCLILMDNHCRLFNWIACAIHVKFN